ncbi:MAG: hypothetical protein AAGB48_11565 [Planctomycetota bacterium]
MQKRKPAVCRRADIAEVLDSAQPGDVIAFSGKGAVSEIVRWSTRSVVSHVGMVCRSRIGRADGDGSIETVDIVESTMLGTDMATGQPVRGVQRRSLSDRVRFADGPVWWLPLSDDARGRLDLRAMTAFVLEHSAKPYDLPQAIGAGLDAMDGLPGLGRSTRNREDFAAMFCSELVAGSLEAGGVTGRINASEVTPIDLCMFTLYGDAYVQLTGEETRITGVNTVDPEGFGLR